MRTQRLYKHVADKLMKTIESGSYPLGSRLPAERELAVEYNVSRPTIREAMIALEIAGKVEVRKGSGVYVIDDKNSDAKTLELDIGPFELTQARILIESEAAGLAATMISAAEVEKLETIIKAMIAENEGEKTGELADKEFHLLIAGATRNSAIASIVEDLWNVRESSALTRTMYDTVRMTGVRPAIDEHWAIYNALKAGDAEGARQAMRDHLSRVIETMLLATEIEAVQEAKRKVSQNHGRFMEALKKLQRSRQRARCRRAAYTGRWTGLEPT